MSKEKTDAAKSGNTRRSGIRIMGQLIGLVKPLLPVMILAIVLGTAGYLCAIFLTILAGYGLMHILLGDGHGTGDSVHRTDGDGSDAGDSPLRRTIL